MSQPRQTSVEPDDERWTVFGIPVFITDQLGPGELVAFTMVYEPTEERPDRYRISAVKVVGLGEDTMPERQGVPPFVNGGCRDGHCCPEWLPDFYGVEHGPSQRRCQHCKRYVRPGTDQPMTGGSEEQAWVEWRRGNCGKPTPEEFPYVA